MTRVKICGVSDPADARRVADLGAWALGMIFWPGARACALGAAEAIGAELQRRLELVGVFVNAALDEVADTADRCHLTWSSCTATRGRRTAARSRAAPGAKVMKAVRVRDAAPGARPRSASTPTSTCSTHTRRERRAGPARRFDWELAGAPRARRRWCCPAGSTRTTSGEAIEAARPFAVDVASGTEAAPGRKDPAKLTAFVRAVERGGRAARGRGVSAPALERRFGPYGGRYVPETLIPALDELEARGSRRAPTRASRAELDAPAARLRRPARRRSTAPRGCPRRPAPTVWLKREDLTHTGSHKINNALGQALLAQRMGKRRVIAETGAGQHGVATATACALLGLECVVYMGTEDMRRQRPNVDRMRLLGAEVVGGGGGRADAQGGRVGGDPRLGGQRRDARTT